MAEPIALLDVNVLIALVDPQHVHHEPSHRWFQAHGLVMAGRHAPSLRQRAVARILGNPRYPNSPGGPVVVMPLLQELLAHPTHVFWLDALSWRSSPLDVFEAEALLHHGQITDAYLLALAVHHQGVLVSFDKSLSSRWVCGGAQALLWIDPG